MILEHFEEDNIDQLDTGDKCCDVCCLKESTTEPRDCMEEMSAICHVVRDQSNKGEKKV